MKDKPKVLRATHEGLVEIAPGIFIKCSVLEDGRSVVMQKHVLGALGRKSINRGAPKDRFFALPDNLKSFDKASLGKRPRIEFIPVSKDGSRANGYEAQINVDICRIYTRALAAGVLHHKQRATAMLAMDIMDALAGVGLESIIHEATGYKDHLEKDAYQKLYLRFLSPGLVPWTKTFPDEFFRGICRLKGWNFNSRSQPKWPSRMGTLIMELVYCALPEKVVDCLKSRTPKERGASKNRLFQHLSEDFGASVLRDRIKLVVHCLRISDTWEAFEYHLDRMSPSYEWQGLLFNDTFATDLKFN